jgi:glycosyltransferase involved in cell wall biosynthesis
MKSVLFVLPVYNEEVQLAGTVRTLFAWCTENLGIQYSWTILIGDNASTDQTPEIARQLEKEFKGVVRHYRMDQKGRGRLLHTVWLEESFDYSLYMDLDLSTDLSAITPSLAALDKGADLTLGTRIAKGARVINRPLKREITSRGFIAILRTVFGSKITDFQCGFKAITKQAALKLLPLTTNRNWFFDAELYVIAEKLGYRIAQIPVTWTDDPGTTVNVMKTVKEDLYGTHDLARRKPWRTV